MNVFRFMREDIRSNPLTRHGPGNITGSRARRLAFRYARYTLRASPSVSRKCMRMLRAAIWEYAGYYRRVSGEGTERRGGYAK